MSIDYIAASLQPLAFGGPAPYTAAGFQALLTDAAKKAVAHVLEKAWRDLETQLRNEMAAQRGGAKWKRPAAGCSLYWKNRVAAAFREKDPAAREAALDKVFWDAAGELTPVTAPLSAGALATYQVRLTIALKRAAINTAAGEAAFEEMAKEAKK